VASHAKPFPGHQTYLFTTFLSSNPRQRQTLVDSAHDNPPLKDGMLLNPFAK